MSGRVGLLGGTFDPIHLGHLAAARAAQDALRLDGVRFIPSSVPPHRPDRPRASGYHRVQMTTLAVAATPGWDVSDVELRRGGASYTFDTLTTLRAEFPASQFFFITGADAFAEIASWRHYPDVLDLAHFVVIARTGYELRSPEGTTARAGDPHGGPRRVPSRRARCAGRSLDLPGERQHA
ncbi:MAG: nicotinate-nucleotide adenylyltransferase [Vicinamibacterales bacterium]